MTLKTYGILEVCPSKHTGDRRFVHQNIRETGGLSLKTYWRREVCPSKVRETGGFSLKTYGRREVCPSKHTGDRRFVPQNVRETGGLSLKTYRRLEDGYIFSRTLRVVKLASGTVKYHRLTIIIYSQSDHLTDFLCQLRPGGV